jgi:hypothetical protein
MTGTFRYAYTFTTANGETTIDTSIASNDISATANTQISLSNIATSANPAVTARNIYRCTGSNCTSWAYLASLGTTGTTYTDTNSITPSGSPPGSNTARTNLNQASVAFSTVTGATSYKIYRSTSSGAEGLIASGVSSSPYTDTGSAATTSAPNGSARIGVGTASPTANLDVRGTGLFKTINDSTTALQVQDASANVVLNVDTVNQRVGIGNSAPTRTLDVTGTFGGNTVVDSRPTETAGATYAVSTRALGYYFSANSGTTNSSFRTVFNITGLPDVEGTMAYIYTESIKGTTGGSQTHTVAVKINNSANDINTIAPATGTGAGTAHEHYIVMYINGGWKISGIGPNSQTNNTFDTADIAEWIHYTGTEPQAGEVLTVGDTGV